MPRVKSTVARKPRRSAARAGEATTWRTSPGRQPPTISGAGPTVLFWSHWEQTGALVERLRTEAADCEVRRIGFAPGGADVNEL